MTYPLSFRKKVLDIKKKEGLSYDAVAIRFGISKTTVFRWSKRLEPKVSRNRKATKIDMDALRRDIEKYPDSYCHERARRFGVSRTGIRDAQRRLGVSYKKNPKASESGSRKKICVLPKA
jgi:transposase